MKEYARNMRKEFPFKYPKGQKPKYETELRAEGHLKIPDGFVAYRRFSWIDDAYFTVHPRIRFRRAVMTYPKKKFVGKFTYKKLNFDHKGTGEVLEYETGAEDPHEAFLIERMGKDPVLQVRGSRKEYRNPKKTDITLCHDEVDGIGKSTEIEKMTWNLMEVSCVQAELVDMIKDMGAKAPIRKDYVDMRMEQEIPRFMGICNYYPTMQTLMNHFGSDAEYMKLVIDRLEEQGKVVRAGFEIRPI